MRLVHYLAFTDPVGQTAEFYLDGCALAFAGEDIDAITRFPHAEFDIVGSADADGQL